MDATLASPSGRLRLWPGGSRSVRAAFNPARCPGLAALGWTNAVPGSSRLDRRPTPQLAARANAAPVGGLRVRPGPPRRGPMHCAPRAGRDAETNRTAAQTKRTGGEHTSGPSINWRA
ncbi:hypothetical protein PC41400_03955 [Paenibacillus chitinolyticus]|nr:hypothetical protein PC41400_03955 [Paenibacillus chitinolyticus]